MRLLLLTATAALVSIGIATIYAIGHPAPGEAEEPVPSEVEGPQTPHPIEIDDEITNKYSGKWKKQVYYVGAGLICVVMINLFHYRRLGPLSYALYGAILFLLALILVDKTGVMPLSFVKDREGIHRWIKVGFGFQIQPSEFCKVATIVALAWYLRFRSNYRTFRGLVGPFALTLLAMALILLEPDLGTTMLLMPILFTMLFVAGARVKHLGIILLIGLAVSPLMWISMKSYQKMRISSVLLQNDKIYETANNHEWLARLLAGSPEDLRKWKNDEGFQLIHAKQAIASGGLTGYGFRKGPYLQYSYLPEADNDMIFPIIGHQFGVIGCGAVIFLYIILIACAIELAWLNTDPFGRLVAAGIAAMFAVQVLVNVGMVLGLMPITGLTLPLISYGGSSMITNMVAVGLLNNIGRHRPLSVAKKPFEFG